MEAGSGAPGFPSEDGLAVCEAIRRQIRRLGHDFGDEPRWQDAVFASETDPYSGDVSQVAVWRGGLRYGKLTRFADGRVFAEYQVLLPHPDDADRYIESVQVWGRLPGQLRGDAVVASLAR